MIKAIYIIIKYVLAKIRDYHSIQSFLNSRIFIDILADNNWDRKNVCMKQVTGRSPDFWQSEHILQSKLGTLPQCQRSIFLFRQIVTHTY